MRKLILFFNVIIVGLILTSCLKATDSNLSRSGELFFITQSEEGVQIAHNGSFAITSQEIQAKKPNQWYLITWSWRTENGVTGANIHKAVTSLIEEVPLGQFIQQADPQVVGAPLLNVHMVESLPLTGTFGDYLIFIVDWNKKEGEKIKLEVYNNTAAELDATGALVFNLRLNNTVDASGKNVREYVAVKMSSLRNLVNFGSENFKDIQIRFNYYKSDTEQAYTVKQLRVYKS